MGQLMKRHITKGKVPSIKQITVEQRKNAHICENEASQNRSIKTPAKRQQALSQTVGDLHLLTESSARIAQIAYSLFST